MARTLTLLSVTEVTTEMGGVGVDSRKRISMLSLLLAPPVETMNAQSAELSSTPQIVSTKESRALVLQWPVKIKHASVSDKSMVAKNCGRQPESAWGLPGSPLQNNGRRPLDSAKGVSRILCKRWPGEY